MGIVAVTECKTADDVRALSRRFSHTPKTPVVHLKQAPVTVLPTAPVFNDPFERRWAALHRAFRMTPRFEAEVLDIPRPEQIMGMNQIAETVAKYFGCTVTDLRSQRRSFSVSYPRQLFCYIVKENSHRSLPMIGRWLGGRDHTTILHAVRKIKKLKETKPTVRADIRVIETELFGESKNG